MVSRRLAVLRWLAAAAALAAGPLPAPAGARVPPGRSQCEALARAALPVAQRMLQSLGEFPPFALAMAEGDEVVEVDAAAERQGERYVEAGEALREKLADALKRREVQATALAYEAAVNGATPGARTDAIAIQLAHRDGYRAVYVVPYRFDNGEVVLGTPHVIEQKGASSRAPPRRKSR